MINYIILVEQRKITGTPLLLIVPGGPTTSASGNSTKRSRFWHHHLSHFGKVIPVTMHLSNSGRGVSIGQCLDHMIGAVQAKVLEVSKFSYIMIDISGDITILTEIKHLDKTQKISTKNVRNR